MKINTGVMVESQKLGFDVTVTINGEQYEFDSFYTGEKKMEFLNALCALIQTTRASGTKENNRLKEIRYYECKGDEWAIPIFEDGCGEPNEMYPHGYYGVCISGDSCIAILMDVVDKFVKVMW